MEEGIVVSNGIAWSRDNKTMYYADTHVDRVYAYDFDIATGEIDNRRLFIDTTGHEGKVDGATMDADGCYWTAMVRGGSIAQWDETGNLVREIPVPVTFPTMPCFGGDDLDTIYVTSISLRVPPEDLETKEPWAGKLMALRGVGARGVPERFFKG